MGVLVLIIIAQNLTEYNKIALRMPYRCRKTASYDIIPVKYRKASENHVQRDAQNKAADIA